MAFFGFAPAVLSLLPRWTVLPAILVGGGLCLARLLRDPTFDRRQLWNLTAARRDVPRVLGRAAAISGALLIVVLLTQHDPPFALPRNRPALWLAMMLAYPCLSVYPQEIMFRTFFFHRYSGILGRPGATIAASGALFGWAHIMVHNLTAMLLTTFGGLLFAFNYNRSRSTLLASLEHALYGGVLLTVGFGGMFRTGLRRLGMALGL